ncbi:MoxR family ATPase [Kordiimonas sp. SCSIO 12610]|uniref:AAA family ATPase n=1 Tax=Kordiimonas sp. SCSIO 12610 TaxID=2829597 RepID=UPI00210C603F|nr:MoxR family ATPase [Kordiimonas sp. SCSIO 12610]UTW56329.1 MoxR family ATPase [Kordiimonas sp. SCSIO 12610]
MNTLEIKDIAHRLQSNVAKAIVGQHEAIDLLFISLLSEGHILFEGVPGVAKTLLAQSFASSIDMRFGRIQFTPDLMPGDVLGTNIYHFETSKFVLTKGPIFTDILLADEVNRTPPKTQAALLQAMHEREVTIDGTHYDLGAGFMVIATQNPIEQQGTYPLPEAQLDRFLFQHILDYPSRDDERRILGLHGHRATMPHVRDMDLQPVITLETLKAMRKTVSEIQISTENLDYIVDLVRGSREHPSVRVGASPRCGAMMARAARACAAMEGRDYVVPDDIKRIILPALCHRLVLSPTAEIEGIRASDVVSQLIEQVKAPR